MVRLTSIALCCLLLAPSLAVPITNNQNTRAEEGAGRDPSFRSASRNVREVATPANIPKVAKASFATRDDELSQRDVKYLDDLATRDPKFFGSVWSRVKRVATPANIAKVASWVIRDDELQLTERDVEYLEDLAARDPRFGSWFKKAVRVTVPVSNLVIRDDELQLAERDDEYLEDLAVREPRFGSWLKKAVRVAVPVSNLVIRDDEFQLTERDLEDLQDLSAREPRRGHGRKPQPTLSVANVVKAAAKIACSFIGRDAEGVSRRSLEYPEDLSIREPSATSFFPKGRGFFNPAKKAAKNNNSEKVGESASLGQREDDDIFERNC